MANSPESLVPSFHRMSDTDTISDKLTSASAFSSEISAPLLFRYVANSDSYNYTTLLIKQKCKTAPFSPIHVNCGFTLTT